MKKDLSNGSVIHARVGELEYIQFRNLLRYEDKITHCITTRKGGVSVGECASLNLGFNRKDTRENVIENYRIISRAMGIDCNDMVFSNQVHDNRIKIVDRDDRGKGIVRESDIIGYDGLVTAESQVALVTFYADCVPLLFFDPVRKVIASSHSGWRSTVRKIALKTLDIMEAEFGCRKENIEVGIGPSIGACCFEVDKEVYYQFTDVYGCGDGFYKSIENDKWLIDLQLIIKHSTSDYGIPDQNICASAICTKCNNDVFYSHRGDCGKTGSMAAIIQIKEII